MDNKLKVNTKIPIFPKPTFKAMSKINTWSSQPSTSNTSNEIKPMISRTHNLRRSKSAADIRTLTMPRSIRGTMQQEQISLPKKPVKRPVLVETRTVPNKTAKLTIPEPNKIKIAKPAPYDYKARFNLLKEQHDKLKTVHRQLKETHEVVSDQNEILTTANETMKSELSETLKLLQTQTIQLSEKIKICDETQKQNKTLVIKNDQLDKEVKTLKQNLENATNELNKIKNEFDFTARNLLETSSELTKTKESLQSKHLRLQSLETEKRKLHNTLQELKGNIRVFCRVRPPLEREKYNPLYQIKFPDEATIELTNGKFSFDRVFGPNSSQEDVFEELSQLVQSALDGYNVCVFAYGQTGSGKTYTMEGNSDPESRGMVPRTIDTIYSLIEESKISGLIYKIKASFLEIYNETIVDLLEPKKNQLEIRMCDSKGTDVYVTNLIIKDIESAEHLKCLMRTAQKNRAVAATENNDRSSRSHSVTKILLEGFDPDRKLYMKGSLNLVDLAGSEKFQTNETTRLRETTNINKSLSNLSNVILCLVQNNSHIPYRNSKLTYLLMPSLGGNSKTLMLVNISPFEYCYNESVNSLRFASTVNQCKTGSIKRTKIQSSH